MVAKGTTGNEKPEVVAERNGLVSKEVTRWSWSQKRMTRKLVGDLALAEGAAGQGCSRMEESFATSEAGLSRRRKHPQETCKCTKGLRFRLRALLFHTRVVAVQGGGAGWRT